MEKAPNDAELLAVSVKFLEEMKKLEAFNKWEEVEEKPVKISKMEREERVVSRAEINLNLPFETVAQFFNDPTFMTKISDRIEKCDVLFKGSSFHVVHLKMKGIALVSDREIVVVFTFHREGNKIYFGNRSCQFPCKPHPDTVRAFNHCSGFIVEPIDGKTTKMVSISDVDLNGSIPGFVKNKVAIMRAGVLAEIEQKIKAALK